MPGLKLTSLTLPDLLTICPFEGETNPHYEDALAETVAWANSYKIFTGKKRAIYDQVMPELFVSHFYPSADAQVFRMCCQYTYIMYAFDETTDDMDALGVQTVGESFLNALSGKFFDGNVISNMVKDFMTRFGAFFSDSLKERFIRHNKEFVDAVVREASLRAEGSVLGVEEYINLRRTNSAVAAFYDLIEVALATELEDAIYNNEVFKKVYMASLDLIAFCNDVLSFKMELSRGLECCNLLSALIQDRGVTIQEAVDIVAHICQERVKVMLDGRSKIVTFGENASLVGNYFAALEKTVVGNINWSFQTKRYFGDEGLKIKENNTITIRMDQVLKVSG